MNRLLLDALYQELFEAKAQISKLEAAEAFPACGVCNCSEEHARHIVKLGAAKDRMTFSERLITLVVGDAQH